MNHHEDCDYYQAVLELETIEMFGLDDERPNPDDYDCHCK